MSDAWIVLSSEAQAERSEALSGSDMGGSGGERSKTRTVGCVNVRRVVYCCSGATELSASLGCQRGWELEQTIQRRAPTREKRRMKKRDESRVHQGCAWSARAGMIL